MDRETNNRQGTLVYTTLSTVGRYSELPRELPNWKGLIMTLESSQLEYMRLDFMYMYYSTGDNTDPSCIYSHLYLELYLETRGYRET